MIEERHKYQRRLLRAKFAEKEDMIQLPEGSVINEATMIIPQAYLK